MKVFVFGLRGFPDVQGGVEKHCEQLYTNFDTTDIEFYIFRRKPYVKNTPTYKNINFIDLPSTTIKGFEAAFHSFLATIYCLFHKTDIIHVHNIGPSLFIPILRLFGKNVIVTYHSANYEHNKWNWIVKKILKFSEFVTFSCGLHIIFVNKFMQESIPVKYISKTSYIPNGFNSNIVRSKEDDELHNFGLTPDQYILSVGRITPEKGFDLLIKAFNSIQDKTIKLCIAGSVETEQRYYTRLKSMIKNPNNLVFTGFVTGNTLSQLYSHTRLFVLSSRTEGFPLVLLDAMAYGNNILASDIPASHLVDLPSECYFDINNTEQFTTKIDNALLIKKGTVYQLDDFKWSNIANQVYKTYKKILTHQ